MKPVLMMCVVLTLLSSMPCIPVEASETYNYPMVKFEDDQDYTIVDQGLVTVEGEIKLMGLNSNFQTIEFEPDQYQYIHWTSDSGKVIMFDNHDYWNFGYDIDDTNSISAIIIGQGTSYITATYDPPVEHPVRAKSYVVAESTCVLSSITTDVSVDFKAGAKDNAGNPINDFILSNLTVPLFSLEEAVIVNDDEDILANSPTPLHALLYALEIQYSSETTSTPITSFNWDWVNENVVMEGGGNYIRAIGTNDTTSEHTRGWQYRIGSVQQHRSYLPATVTPISSSDDVFWGYWKW